MLKVILHVSENDSKCRDVAPLKELRDNILNRFSRHRFVREDKHQRGKNKPKRNKDG